MATQEYLNCIFEGVDLARTRLGTDYAVFVKEVDSNGSIKILFTEKTFCTFTASSILGWDNEKTTQEIKRITFARAKARLTLGEYAISEEYEKIISSTTVENSEKQGSFDEEIIQASLLKGLRNIRLIKPENFECEKIDVEGFCELLNISRDAYLYNAGILKENNFIKEGKADQLTIENGGIFITNTGIENLKEVRVNSCGPLAKVKCDCKGTIKKEFASNKIFLDIPYSDYSECEEVLRDILREGGLQAIVARDRLTSNAVLCKVCAMIQTCKYGLTDISSASNSVSYEYGLMHGFGMKVCLLLREASEKFTDIHGLEHISYIGLSSFKTGISKWLLENVREINKAKMQNIIDTEEKHLAEKDETPLKNISRVDTNANAVLYDRKEKIITTVQGRSKSIMENYSGKPYRLMYAIPSKSLIPIVSLKSLLEKKENLVLLLKEGDFFPCEASYLSNRQDSLLYSFEKAERSYGVWYEVDINGLVYFRETVYEYNEATKEPVIDAFVTLKRLLSFLMLTQKIFKALDYSNTIDINHGFYNVHGVKLVKKDSIGSQEIEGEIKHDNEILSLKVSTISDASKNQVKNILLDIYEQIRASAGMGEKAFDRELTSKQLEVVGKNIFADF